MTKPPKDIFDDVAPRTERVGAHRQPIRRRPWWFHAAISLGSVVTIILGALVGISIIDAKTLQALDIPTFGDTATPTPTPTPTPTVSLVDPLTMTKKAVAAVSITVLNGTSDDGLAESVADMVRTAGWTSVSSAAASDTSIKVSVVVYGPDEDLPFATSVAASLGITAVKQSDVYPGAKVTVLVGSDFVN